MLLKEHLPKQDKIPYYPTTEDTLYWFRNINRCVFDNRLIPFSAIIIKRLRNIWAQVYYDDEIKSPPIELHLNIKFPNKFHFVTVLGHEMVHKWQLEINLDTGSHNKHFYSWKQTFKENGLILTRTV